MALYYSGDDAYPVEEYDSVAILAGELRIPAMVKKVLPRRRELIVTLEGIDPILDLVLLRKTARVPLSGVEFVGRGH